MFNKIKKYFKSRRELEEDLKMITEELRITSNECDKLRDALDKDTQAKKIKRISESLEHERMLKHGLRTENTNLRIENVELRAKIRNGEAVNE